MLAHCILSDLSVAKVLKWRIPEIFDLTFDDLMDLPPKFESVPSVSTLPFVCYQIEKCGGKDFDPTSLSRSRAILDSLLVVLMVLKKNSIPQPAFTLVSELISRTTEKWTGRQIVSGFIQSSAKEMEFIEWLGIFHNLSIMTKWVQLNDKLLNLIAALSSFPWLNERSSFESDDMVVFAENWAKLVNLAANLSQESDLINKCLIVLSSLPSQVCPKWRKRVMKTHLQLYNGEKAMEFWLQNIPLYVATMGSGCFGDFIEGTFSPAVLCANAYQPGVMEMYFKALSQLVCLKCNCTKLRWTYIGSHSLNGKLTDSIFIPTINCSKTCDSLPGISLNFYAYKIQ